MKAAPAIEIQNEDDLDDSFFGCAHNEEGFDCGTPCVAAKDSLGETMTKNSSMKLPESDAKSRRQRFLDASNRSLKSVEYSVERSYNHSISDNDRFGFENE